MPNTLLLHIRDQCIRKYIVGNTFSCRFVWTKRRNAWHMGCSFSSLDIAYLSSYKDISKSGQCWYQEMIASTKAYSLLRLLTWLPIVELNSDQLIGNCIKMSLEWQHGEQRNCVYSNTKHKYEWCVLNSDEYIWNRNGNNPVFTGHRRNVYYYLAWMFKIGFV